MRIASRWVQFLSTTLPLARLASRLHASSGLCSHRGLKKLDCSSSPTVQVRSKATAVGRTPGSSTITEGLQTFWVQDSGVTKDHDCHESALDHPAIAARI